MRLPKGKAILDDAKLEFINFENVLHAGKRERAHRVVGYISIIHPESVDLIFLQQGEPFNAARLTQSERSVVPIKEVIEKAKKATAGIVSYYATDQALLDMIIASITDKPIKSDVEASRIQPKILIDRLKHSNFSGFLWLRNGREESFMQIHEGQITACYLSGEVGKIEDESVILKYLSNPNLKISVFDKIPKGAAVQATPSQIDMFLKVFTALHKGFGKGLGAALVIRTSMMAKDTSQKEFPFLENFKITPDLSIVGDAMVEPEVLVKGFARWFDIIFESSSTFLGKDAEKVVREALKDFRFALKAARFFDFTKWKIE